MDFDFQGKYYGHWWNYKSPIVGSIFFVLLLVSTNTTAEGGVMWVLEGDLSKIRFEDNKFGGDTSHAEVSAAHRHWDYDRRSFQLIEVPR